jgi:uncharacterized protein
MNRNLTLELLSSLLLVVLGLLVPRPALAGTLDIERPGQRQFVADHAEILDAEDEREIRRIAEQLLDEHATPIVVLTIESMAAHGGGGMDIETFTRILFDQWGVGHPTINGASWDTGILLVISKHDRKARIELGSGWAHEKDAEAEHIMQARIIPAFRDGDYSSGTVAGVEALATMARSKPLPEPSRPLSFYFWVAVGIVLVLAILVSLVKSGLQGWGWKSLVLVFTLLGAILGLLSLLGRSKSRASGRRLGSFGKGRSGGGGATGSW